MKKLTKFQINPEKLMKNSELLTLRGGYGGTETAVCKKFYYDSIIVLGSVCVANCNSNTAYTACHAVYPDTSFGQCLGISCP